jgi:hypothetical protein
MYFWVQGLYPSIHHLGKAGIAGNLSKLYTGISKCLSGPARTQDAVFLLYKLLREFDNTGLVPDREQCPLHGLVYAGQERKMYAGYYLPGNLPHPLLE